MTSPAKRHGPTNIAISTVRPLIWHFVDIEIDNPDISSACAGAYVIAGQSAGRENEKPRAELKRPWKALRSAQASKACASTIYATPMRATVPELVLVFRS